MTDSVAVLVSTGWLGGLSEAPGGPVRSGEGLVAPCGRHSTRQRRCRLCRGSEEECPQALSFELNLDLPSMHAMQGAGRTGLCV